MRTLPFTLYLVSVAPYERFRRVDAHGNRGSAVMPAGNVSCEGRFRAKVMTDARVRQRTRATTSAARQGAADLLSGGSAGRHARGLHDASRTSLRYRPGRRS